MFSTLRLAILGLVVASIAGAYITGRGHGKAALKAKLAADRIKILQDGKEIDAEVLATDDEGLCALLGGCAPDGVRSQGSAD